MARNLPPFDPRLKPAVSDLPDLGKLVRNRRAKAKLRIDDAAALCGVSGDVLSRLENGKPVTADNLLLVLDGLGLRMLVVPTEDVATMLAAPPRGAADE
jgi:transcriptional regulator with XRE-family HTH domain